MFALVLLTSVSLGAFDVQLQTLDGKSAAGNLVALSSEKVVLQTKKQKQTIELKNVMSLSSNWKAQLPQTRPTVWVTLVDGSQLSATKFAVTKRQATITFLRGDKLQLSTRNIKAVRFRPMTDDLKKVFSKSLKNTESEDVIIIRNSKGVVNSLGGVLGDLNQKGNHFDIGGDVVIVPMKKVQGQVYFHPRGRQFPQTICIIEDAADQKIVVREMKLVGTQVNVITPAGLKLSIPLASIKKFDFSAGKVVFLSDIEPSKLVWQPYFDSPMLRKKLAFMFRPRMDESLFGGKLQINRPTESGEVRVQSFNKGLSVFSRTTLVYRLPEDVRLFQTTAAIDSRTRGKGSVVLMIYGDEKLLLKTTVTGKSDPKLINLKIEKVARLKIVVDYGEKMDTGDYLNLCNARIIK